MICDEILSWILSKGYEFVPFVPLTWIVPRIGSSFVFPAIWHTLRNWRISPLSITASGNPTSSDPKSVTLEPLPDDDGGVERARTITRTPPKPHHTKPNTDWLLLLRGITSLLLNYQTKSNRITSQTNLFVVFFISYQQHPIQSVSSFYSN